MKLKLLALVFVSSLMAAAQTPHSATLKITSVQPSTITGNSYYQSTTSGGPYTIVPVCTNIAPTATCSITTGLVGSTTYYWVATAICSSCQAPTESAFSNQVFGTTKPDAPPPPVPPVLGNPFVASLSPPVVDVSWKLSTMKGVTVQKVLRQTGGVGNWVQQKQLSPTTNMYPDKNVKVNKGYAYMLQAWRGQDVVMASKASIEVMVK